MTLSEPIARTRERLTEMATELRSTGGKPGTYTLAVTDRVPELLDHIEAQAKRIAWLEADHARDSRLIDHYRIETAKLRTRVDELEGGPDPTAVGTTGRCGICGEPVVFGDGGWLHFCSPARSHDIDGVTVDEPAGDGA